MPRILAATFILVLSAAAACRGNASSSGAADTSAPFSARRAAACSRGQTVDSSYVRKVAAEVFAPGRGLAVLEPITYEPVVAPGPIEEGILVRLVSRGGRQVGGGGLAYVDIETGCAVALKSYE